MEKTKLNDLIALSIANAMSYGEYRTLAQNHSENGSSSGSNQSEAFVNYTKLGHTRMKRLDKTVKISEEIITAVQAIEKKTTWLVISETWCGDAGHALPIFNKLAALNDNIDLKVVLRDENKDLMNQFLTNGGMSIPKMVQVQEDEVTATWGPRPSAATALVNEFKAEHGGLTPEFKEDLQGWYNKDKGQNIASDLAGLLA